MAGQISVTLTKTGANMPENQTAAGPITDTFSTNVATTSGQLTPPNTTSGTWTQIPLPTTGCGLLTLFAPASNAIAISIASVSAGTNAINLGSGWTWLKLGYTPGTTNIYIACASSSGPQITWIAN